MFRVPLNPTTPRTYEIVAEHIDDATGSETILEPQIVEGFDPFAVVAAWLAGFDDSQLEQWSNCFVEMSTLGDTLSFWVGGGWLVKLRDLTDYSADPQELLQMGEPIDPDADAKAERAELKRLRAIEELKRLEQQLQAEYKG